ncbi:probable transcription factor At4g00390 [Sorghum bicolor]|uniref:probable transcription factor At4g00390 n=1 Tax=Sorghum bicolor TaxID=4558 RepID=UPI000B425E6D|nr:probable transcription factor At4g00390 [Sorghum bicolor]|eukprot:XP_021321536.1 probable transcription factor At4g00390 [Sorghum bicolor]
MAPKRPAAAAGSGSASDASDGEAGAAPNSHRRRASPSPSRSRSRSRSKSPRSNARPSVAASDSDADARAPSPRRANRERSPRDHLDSDADADAGAGTGRRAPSPRRRGERSPSFHSDSDSDADAAGRSPSPRRKRERTPGLRSDSDSDNSAAAAASDDDGGGAGDASPLPSARRSFRIETSNVKPVSTRPMDVPLRGAAGSSQRRPKRRPSPHSPEHQKRPPRVWSPEDEVTILSALIEFRAKKGRLPASIQDTGKVHSQIIHQLTANASTAQLSDKVRRLKHKYKLLLTRAKNGRDPNLPTQHDRDVYQLSKKVWGLKSLVMVRGSRVSHEDTEDAEESNEEQEIEESDEDMENGWELRDRTSKKPKALTFGNGNGNAIVTVGRGSHGDGSGRDDTEKGKQMYPYLWEAVEELSKEHPSGPIFRKAFGVLEKSKARAVEEKLRKFRMSEIRQQLQRMDLMKETVGMVLDALEGAY